MLFPPIFFTFLAPTRLDDLEQQQYPNQKFETRDLDLTSSFQVFNFPWVFFDY